ncbi:hypothetical protein LUW75_07410 [Streptomyces sp. MRC013]|uniref:hypothetical protein n=1 Tax=Streptomyces sp. MRC013 TaxID=2898276 RepID=UPI0020264DAE|nr:hypothetical protein [Streptomyces sp. MRC013]URM89848.1 hypothetical protein LUW75_07410 [Streptomyces sp. MRC013]
MPNPSHGRREARFPWWPTISVLCAGCVATLLYRRAAVLPPPPAGRRGGGGPSFPDDAVTHLSTSW